MENIERAIDRAVRKLSRLPVAREDLTQEAWAIALSSKTGAVSADILKKKLGNRVAEWMSVARLGNVAYSEHETPVRVECTENVAVTYDTPESALLGQERKVRFSKWRDELFEHMRAALGEEGWRATKLLYGFEGDPKSPADVAASMKWPAARVYRLHRKIKETRTPALLWLRKRLAEVGGQDEA